MRMMIQFITNNNNGDHRDRGAQCIIQDLKSVGIIAMLSLSMQNYDLFVVIGEKFHPARYSKNLHST